MLTVYREAARSADELRGAIRDSIETYEPRLRRVRVRRRDTKAYTMRLVFVVSAELEGGERVQFETTFESQASTTVEPLGAYG
jgi:type VI secretion system protein